MQDVGVETKTKQSCFLIVGIERKYNIYCKIRIPNLIQSFLIIAIRDILFNFVLLFLYCFYQLTSLKKYSSNMKDILLDEGSTNSTRVQMDEYK